MSNDTQLLPCPFCEGPPETVVARVVGGGEFPDAEMAGDDGLHAEAYVFCHECGAQGESFDDTVYDRTGCDGLLQQAVSAWQDRNSRHRHLYDYTQPETWKVLPSSPPVTGEALHATYPGFKGDPWAISRDRAMWNDWAERVNAHLAAPTGELKQEAKE